MQNITLDLVGLTDKTTALATTAAASELKDKLALAQRQPTQMTAPDRKVYADLNADGIFECIAEAPKPLPTTAKGGSLNAIVDYLKANPDGLPLDKTFVLIHSPTEVSVVVGADEHGRRYTPFQVGFEDVAEDVIGVDLEQEDAVIGLMTRFRESDDRAYIARVIGNLRAEAVQTNRDNGFNQVVATQKGITAGMEEVKNPVMLNPIRSFPEINVGQMPFLVRFKQVDERGTPASRTKFIEGDGGAWRSKAKDLIGKYIADSLGDLKIAGVLR